MTDVTVIRGDGHRAGQDINSPILCADAPAIARGRTEIDLSTPAADITIEARFQPEAMPGQTIDIYPTGEPRWRGVITGVRHYSKAVGVMRTELTVWRPRT
jgi:hypothetical protein